ncbi:MAG: hypothetical protein IMZ70_07960 [Candidatus Atribacteria bacterium]|nr:hypothetical protein [Candidatus Atribacteria bacterium]MBE3145034.1 hypothetical protein [Planctomycetota bacterium]
MIREDEIITLSELTEKDKGRWVLCKLKEVGRIKSWNDLWVFVVYHCDGQWDNYTNYTATATKPEELTFTRLPKKKE